MSLELPVLGYRNALFDRIARESRLEAVLTVGAGARHAAAQWPGRASCPVFDLVHPAADENIVMPNWNQRLTAVHAAVRPDEGAEVDLIPYGSRFSAADEAAIPRFDLPFGVPDWHGSGGGRSQRSGPNSIVWTAP